MWTVLGSLLVFFGAVMMFRGWNYYLHPEGPRALQRKAKNVELGFPTDMKVFGKKVRRLGTILTVLGLGVGSIPWW
jgi:hypothetical protein